MPDPGPIDGDQLVPLLAPLLSYMTRRNVGRVLIETVESTDLPGATTTAVLEESTIGDFDEDPSPYGMARVFFVYEDDDLRG